VLDQLQFSLSFLPRWEIEQVVRATGNSDTTKTGLKMVQQLEATDARSAEQSPLLSEAGNLNGRDQTYLSIIQVRVSPCNDRELPDSNRNGTAIKTSRSRAVVDEERQDRERVEGGMGRGHVVRIVSVLLIGLSLSLPSYTYRHRPVRDSNELNTKSWHRHLRRQRRWIHSPSNLPRYRF
jgi:hypothetical protein